MSNPFLLETGYTHWGGKNILNLINCIKLLKLNYFLLNSSRLSLHKISNLTTLEKIYVSIISQ